MSNTVFDNIREGRCNDCPWAPCIDFDGFCPIDYATFTRLIRKQEEQKIERDNALKDTFFPEEPRTLIVKVRDKIDLEYAQLLSKKNPVVVFGEEGPEELDGIIRLNEEKRGISLKEACEQSWGPKKE